MKNKIIWMIATVFAIISNLSLQAAVPTLFDNPPENELWFRVDGIDYCYDETTGICSVRDYMMDVNGCMSGWYREYVNIPATVTYDGKEYTVEAIDAFKFCSPVWEVTIPSTVKSIRGFNSVYGLMSLNIPPGVEVIKGGSGLLTTRRIMLPPNPVNIDFAFEGLVKLQEVIVYCPEPYEWGEYTFRDTPIESCVLYVPRESIFEYMAAPGWRDFGAIIEWDSYGPFDSDEITGVASPEITIDMMPVQGGVRLVGYSGNVEVYDLEGKLVTNVEVSDGGTVDVAPGIYVVKAGNIRGKICVKY